MTEPAVPGIKLTPTACAVCETFGNATEMYPPTYDDASFNERIFSARRLPDAIHYRIVRCNRCGLVRSDPAADQATLSGLYERSTFDYGSEVPNLRRTYARYLAKAQAGALGRSYLEIGCGNGFMLEEALARGYETVRGVEPSRGAVEAASPSIRDRIVVDIMRPGLFGPGEFDTACMFQVFDHLPQPGALLDQIHTVLTRRGVLLCFNHNVNALSARVLGERSPIVDIEHCYLYSPETMKLMLERHGFEVMEVGPASNTLSLRHLLHLLPGPPRMKRGLTAIAQRLRVAQLSMRMSLGNLYIVGRRS